MRSDGNRARTSSTAKTGGAGASAGKRGEAKYGVGDFVVYGRIGVCKVEAVGATGLQSADENKDYYTLSLVHREGNIYLPVDTRAAMRPVMTRKAALALIKQIPSIDESAFEARDMGALKQHYDSLLLSDDCADLVHVIKSVYVKKQSLADRGKNLGKSKLST